MHPIKPMLVRSAAPRDTHELPEGLRDDIFEVWAEVEALEPPTCAPSWCRYDEVEELWTCEPGAICE